MKACLNRDIAAIGNMLYAMREMETCEEIRMRLQDRLWNMTRPITGMPGGRGGGGGLEAQFAAISEAEEEYRRRAQACAERLKECRRILDSIREYRVRVFVEMRYVAGKSRREVMEGLGLTRRQYERMCEAVEGAERMERVTIGTSAGSF